MRIGIHTSRSKSLEDAALKAHELGANTFQIFSASPRMWRAVPPDAADVKRLRAARERLDLNPMAIHTNYLVNLAALDPEIRAKSIASFRGELDRAAVDRRRLSCGASWQLPGPVNRRRDRGVVLGLAEAAEGFGVSSVTVLLENTVGCGCQLGIAL